MTSYRHNPGGDPFVRIGEQDITAHVDFTAVIHAGDRTGLHRESLTTQRDFLCNLGLDVFMDALTRQRLPYQEYVANRSAILELVRPEGFGSFKVLVQSKNIDGAGPHGLRSDNDLRKRLRDQSASLHVPLLGRDHIALSRAAYPDEGIDTGTWV